MKQQKLEDLKAQNQTQVLTVAKILADRYSSHEQASDANSDIAKNEKSSSGNANNETINAPSNGERLVTQNIFNEVYKDMGQKENHESENKSPQQLRLESDALSAKSAELGHNIKLESSDNQSDEN